MKCFQCNEEIADNAKFCKFCAADQSQNPTTTTPTAPKCTSCGADLAANTKFCKFCGAGQGNGVAPAPQSPQSGIPQANPINVAGAAKQKIGSTVNRIDNKMKLMIGCAVAGSLILAVSFSTLAGFGKSTLSFTNNFEKQALSIAKQLPVYTHIQDMMKSEYKTILGEGADVVTIYSDYADNNYKINFTTLGINSDLFITEKVMTIETDLLNDSYGLDLKNLTSDLNNCEYLDFNLPKNLDLTADLSFEIYDKVNKIVTNNFKTLVKKMDIEKTDKETLPLKDGEKDATSYLISLTPDVLRSVLESAKKDIFDDKELQSLIYQLFLSSDMQEMITDLFYGYSISSGYDTAYLEQTISNYFDNMIDEFVYDYNRYWYDSISVVVSIYKDDALQLKLYSTDNRNDSMEYLIELDKNEILFTTRNSYSDGYDQVSITFDDNLFVYETLASGNSIEKLVYDTKGDYNNVTSYYRGSANSRFTLDSVTNKNGLIYRDDYIYVESTKENLKSSFFDYDKSYKNVLKMTEADFFSIAAQLGTSMFF